MAVITYKWPNCDGGLIFDPESQKFHCEYCLSYFSEEELQNNAPSSENETRSSEQTQETQESPDTTVIYTCPSCGAEVVTDETTAATFCFYCHNPVVLSGKLDGKFRPDQVVPFQIDRDTAVNEFLKWAHKKKFVPRNFYSEKQLEKITGVYFPYWITDGDVYADLNTVCTRVRSWRSGDTQYTETSYFDVHRSGNIHFSDMTANALQHENLKLIEGIQPFDYSTVKEFHPSFLSGFQAEKRNIEKEQLRESMERCMAQYSNALLRDSINNYNSVRETGFICNVQNTSWRYLLLPVWVLTYKAHNKKIYTYMMNGQTGKLCGKLPIDFKRLAALFGIVSGGIILLSMLGSLLGGVFG